MAVSTLSDAPLSRPPVLNLPNALTLSRLVLAVVLFALMAFGFFKTSFVVFVVAASTDWLDGYVARKRGETTVLGRILDPFVDKVVVIGAFVFLLPIPGSGLAPWMVVVVIARELLVTGLRSYLESEGVAFGADWAGKFKMVLQCVAIGTVLFCFGFLAGPPAQSDNVVIATLAAWAPWIRTAIIWAALAITAASGVLYVLRAVRLLAARHVH